MVDTEYKYYGPQHRMTTATREEMKKKIEITMPHVNRELIIGMVFFV